MTTSGYRIFHEDGNRGSQSMNRIALTLLFLPMLFATPLSAARPVVSSPSFVESFCRDASTQRRESRRANRSASDRLPDRRVLDSALEQYLVLIETLGNRARRVDGATGSRFLLAAVTLREGLPDIEDLFSEFATGRLPESTTSEIRSLLIDFTRSVRAGLSRLPNTSVENPEESLISILAPLSKASQLAAETTVPLGWWRFEVDGNIPDPIVRKPDLESLEDLQIEDALRSELSALSAESTLLSAATELCSRLESVTWLHSGSRRDLLSVLRIELERIRFDQGSEERLVRRIEAIGQLIHALDELSRTSGGRPVARSGSESLSELRDLWPERFPPADSTSALAGVVGTLGLIRDRHSTGLEGEDARIHTRISKQCLLAERMVFDSFAEIVRTDSPWTDPGAVVVLAESRDLLDALTWLHELKTWRIRLDHLDQPESEELISALRGLISAMVDQDTRENSRRVLREFERQLDMFILLDQADDYLDSRHVDRLSNAWREWIRDWLNGRSAGRGGQVLFNYRRLLDHLRLIESTDRDALERVDDWSAWELSIEHILDRRESFEDLVDEFSNAIELDDQSKANRVAIELEHPFSGLRLVGAVSERAPDHSQYHPAMIAIGEIAVAPSHDGLLMEERSRLAVITHALLEIEFLKSLERAEEARSLQDWVQREMLRLNRRMGLVPARPLAVPGMREDAAPIGVDGMQMMQ